jgi:hypothetical protein
MLLSIMVRVAAAVGTLTFALTGRGRTLNQRQIETLDVIYKMVLTAPALE